MLALEPPGSWGSHCLIHCIPDRRNLEAPRGPLSVLEPACELALPDPPRRQTIWQGELHSVRGVNEDWGWTWRRRWTGRRFSPCSKGELLHVAARCSTNQPLVKQLPTHVTHAGLGTKHQHLPSDRQRYWALSSVCGVAVLECHMACVGCAAG